ncbi:MAG: hypothetical protein ACJ75B_15820 [Flavisolibacter sp.]
MKTDRIIDFFLEAFGWIQIVSGCFMAIVLFGAGLCQAIPAKERLHLFFMICEGALLLGIFWASFVWMKYGTTSWLSRIKRIS